MEINGSAATVLPGTTETLMIPPIKSASGKRAGRLDPTATESPGHVPGNV